MRFVLLTLVACTLMLAQSTGILVGTVSDISGAVVPGVSIRVTNQGTGQQTAVTSDPEGRFVFPRLPVGSYRLEATRPGFRQFIAEGIRLDSDQSRQVNMTFEIG